MNEVLSMRVRAAQDSMRERGVDVMFIGPSADMFYLIGRRLPQTERFNTLVIPSSGTPFIVVPGLQAPLVEDLANHWTIRVWTETEDPTALAAGIAKDRAARTVAVDSHFWASFLLPLQRHLPAARFIDASGVLGPMRLIKSAEELALLKDAALRFDAIWQEFFTLPVIGVTEKDIADRVGELVSAHGFGPLAWCDVGSGPNGASPLHHWSDRRIASGDPIVLDFAATLDGYYMDTCRTPVAGEPHPDFVAIYDIVNRAHDAAAAAALPGVTAESVDRAARTVIADAGYGERFIHRVGHGLGIDAHEDPYIVAGNTAQLMPGMVFSNEPGIYIPGRWGVRIENIMVMTESGARSLNRLGRELVVMS